MHFMDNYFILITFIKCTQGSSSTYLHHHIVDVVASFVVDVVDAVVLVVAVVYVVVVQPAVVNT